MAGGRELSRRRKRMGTALLQQPAAAGTLHQEIAEGIPTETRRTRPWPPNLQKAS